MNVKSKPSSVISCPVPPWNAKNLVQLATYLGLSQAKLAETLKISFSTLQAWVSGKRKINTSTLSSFKNPESQFSKLRSAALENESKRQKLAAKAATVRRKPWTVPRIMRFMNTWGLGQIEMSVFCGVSVDTVISWGLGRRKLVRPKISDHITNAEKAAESRSFSAIPSSNIKNRSWTNLLKFSLEKFPNSKREKIKDLAMGQFRLFCIESKPGVLSLPKSGDSITLKSEKRSKNIEIELKIGKKVHRFSGQRKKIGKISLIEIITKPDDTNFFNGRVGCIRYRAKTVHVNLWSSANLPIRAIAGV